jgi:hypothetical protein
VDEVRAGGDLAAVAPWALLIAVLVAVQMLLSAVQRERQQLLGETVIRSIQDTVLDVTTAVDLAVYDDPAFHNRVRRIQRDGHRPRRWCGG